MATYQKKVVQRRAHLVFTDESGLLLLPLVRRTLAPCGQTPVLRHRARHRDKVSVAAALTLSPIRSHVSLYHQTYPNLYVNSDAYATFLRQALMQHVGGPVVLVHDQGSMHKGDPLRALLADFPRLEVHPLPPYAPELNPVEHLWNFEKDKELSNFVPHAVAQLNQEIGLRLEHVRHDQQRLRSFYAATPLPWDGLTRFF